VNVGDPTQLICDVTTEGSAEIKWEKVQGMIASYAIDDGYGYLNFPYTTLTDAGQYRCIAKNDAGQVDALLELYILGEDGEGDGGGLLTGEGADVDYEDGKVSLYFGWIKKNVSKLKLQYLENYALCSVEISHTITNEFSFPVHYASVVLLIFP
jgi:hypothetical protein